MFDPAPGRIGVRQESGEDIMANRRDILKAGLLAGGAALTSKGALGQLCGADTEPLYQPSPPTRPFVAPLFIPPVLTRVSQNALQPPPDPTAHQAWSQFPPQKFYIENITAFNWRYHPDLPATASIGFNGILPGPTIISKYGEPILVRRYNNLPPNMPGPAFPGTSTHLHNFHTPSESDGNPLDYILSGQYRDHHYPMYPAGGDPREILNTLWYHDHMLGFTAPNVYAGLSAFHLMFDELDSGNEQDPNPSAFRLPYGKGGIYDVPMILHDVLFDPQGQAVYNPFLTDGILGDKFTVNRVIQPYFVVARRKYRFRILNGGPSRFYKLYLGNGAKMTQVTINGNFLPAPAVVDSINLAPAERSDVIVDFSSYAVGTKINLVNRLEQTDPKGPSGKLTDPGDQILQFVVGNAKNYDPSRIPDSFRPLPSVDMNEVVQERLWTFDYDGGMWTVNGLPMDMNRMDAFVKRGTAEVWTIRNEGSTWSHPVHIHFEEFQQILYNGKPLTPGDVELGRKDVIRLGPNDEVKCFFRFRDFVGKYVMHCHNVVHEDHAMMIQFTIQP
jgi:FtsP/CotA-like multicopper oxidase with cupredoxin domain